MRAKITPTKNFGMKKVRKNHVLPILTPELWRKTKQWHKKYKNNNFVPKDVQRILSSQKVLEKYNELWICSIKKVFLKFSQEIFTENTGVGASFLIKMVAFRPATLLKTNSNIGVFLWILQNLKNISELLFEPFPPYRNNKLYRKSSLKTKTKKPF